MLFHLYYLLRFYIVCIIQYIKSYMSICFVCYVYIVCYVLDLDVFILFRRRNFNLTLRFFCENLILYTNSCIKPSWRFMPIFCRHALPPGFILKSDRKKMEEQKEVISIEELVEKERAALGSNVTKVREERLNNERAVCVTEFAAFRRNCFLTLYSPNQTFWCWIG